MYLVHIKADGEILKWNLNKDKTTVGREPKCDIYFDDVKISRLHGEFHKTGNNVFYIDHNSRNGSFINEELVRQRLVVPGDTLRLGDTIFKICGASETGNIVFEERESDIEEIVKDDFLFEEVRSVAEKFSKAKDETRIITFNKDEYIKTESLLKNLKAIYDFSKIIYQQKTKSSIYELIKSFIFAIFPDAENFYIFLGENTLCLEPALIVSKTPKPAGEQIAISKTIFNKAISEKSSILGCDVLNDKRFETSQSALEMNLRSILVAPLFYKNRLTGVIYLDNRSKSNVFKNSDPQLLMAISDCIAVALENAKREENLTNSYYSLLCSVIQNEEKKSTVKYGHTERTSQFALGIGKMLNISEEQFNNLKMASQLHHLSVIPEDNINLMLTNMERKDQLSGTNNSEKIFHYAEVLLKPHSFLSSVYHIIRNFKENFGGGGFPNVLKGETIPIESRILRAACDFDSKISSIPNADSVDYAESVSQMFSHAGTIYDHNVIKALQKFVEQRTVAI